MPDQLPRLDQFDDFALLGPEDVEGLNRRGAEAFIDAHGEYFPSEFNSLALMKWCNDRSVPFTRRNLEVAHRELAKAGTLETRPPAPRSAPRRIKTKAVEGRLATLQPTAAEAVFLNKVADDPSLTDHQRKARDAKLRRAAVAQRRQFPHGEPSIVI